MDDRQPAAPASRFRTIATRARLVLRASGWLTVAFAVAASPLGAQEIGGTKVRVNYVYATQFGFGGYEVGGLRVGVYSLPLGLTFDDVLGDWDLQVDFPVTYGHFRFREDAVLESGETTRIRTEINTIGGEPRLQLDIPIPGLPGFRISPLGAFGFGTTFSSSGSIQRDGVVEQQTTDEDAFYTYQIGLSSLYQRRWRDFVFSFGNAFIYAGDATFAREPGDVVEGYGTFRTGVQARHPLGFKIANFIPDAGVFFVYHLFTPALQFTRVGETSLEIDQIFEIGGTIGATQDSRIGWLPDFLNRAVNRFNIGIGYQTGQDLNGFRLSFGYPF